jgi:hypothetical protein
MVFDDDGGGEGARWGNQANGIRVGEGELVAYEGLDRIGRVEGRRIPIKPSGGPGHIV